MSFKTTGLRTILMAGACLAASTIVARADGASCPVSYGQLKKALVTAINADKTGFLNPSWGVVVNRAGVVCAVAFTGPNVGSQWLASRQIAAAKAFTANGLSLDIGAGNGTGALSTAQLYQFVQPSNASIANPLFGLNGGNVIDSTIVYQGNYNTFGSPADPMIGYRVGGTITFGGGLALYQGSTVVGGLGLSGDTACADHSRAWRTRIGLGLQQTNPQDKLTFATNAQMTNGHPHCPNDAATQGATNDTTAAN